MSDWLGELLSTEIPASTATLLAVLVGGLITAVTTRLLDRNRDRAAARAELRTVRRETEVEALDVAFATTREFEGIFAHNILPHGKTKKGRKEDQEQATQVEKFAEHSAALDAVAVRVEVLASPEMAEQLRDLHGWFVGRMQVSLALGGFDQQQMHEAVGGAWDRLEALQGTVRRDVGADSIDPHGPRALIRRARARLRRRLEPPTTEPSAEWRNMREPLPEPGDATAG